MDSTARREAKARVMALSAYDVEKDILDKLELRLIRLFNQTHTSAGGRKRKLNKREKVKRANELIDKALDGVLDIDQDAINNVRLEDNA